MNLTVDNFTMWEILKLEKKFIYNTEYQRSEIWDKERKQKLIDSIIKNLSIGMLFLRRRGSKYEVLDGQQRLKTIFEFKHGKFKTSPEFTPEFPDKDYRDLTKDSKRFPAFTAFKVYYTLVEGGTEDQVSDIFLRLQEGMSLNTAERLNAMLGEMRKFIINITKHGLFKNLRIDDFRFTHRLLAAQCVLLELEKNFDEKIFPDLRRGHLLRMYKEFKLSVPKWLRSKVLKVVNFINDSLHEDVRVIWKKTDLPILYIVTSYLIEKYIVKKSMFRKFVIDFFTNLSQAEFNSKHPRKNEFLRYLEWSRHGLTEEAFKHRFNLLLQNFLRKYPKIKLKADKRFFDYNQKIYIYYIKDKQICHFCHKKVPWSQASFHHKRFYSKGGTTTIKNGWLMHTSCHTKYHKKYGEDTE